MNTVILKYIFLLIQNVVNENRIDFYESIEHC